MTWRRRKAAQLQDCRTSLAFAMWCLLACSFAPHASATDCPPAMQHRHSLACTLPARLAATSLQLSTATRHARATCYTGRRYCPAAAAAAAGSAAASMPCTSRIRSVVSGCRGGQQARKRWVRLARWASGWEIQPRRQKAPCSPAVCFQRQRQVAAAGSNQSPRAQRFHRCQPPTDHHANPPALPRLAAPPTPCTPGGGRAGAASSSGAACGR